MILSLPQALTEAAARDPDREAVRCRDRSWTYADLERQANSLAQVLSAQGARRGDRVGLFLNKSLESIAAIYGIMKAGAAYVPLDPFAPTARLQQVIADCGINILVTWPNKLAQVRPLLGQTPLTCLIGVEENNDLLVTCVPWTAVSRNQNPAAPTVKISEIDLAYILYTSGSTGRPKGITHSHRSALSFARWAASAYGLRADDRISQHAPLHFDLSTFDLFATALAGGTAVLIPEFTAKFPASISRLIETEKLTVWYSVPFALIQLVQRGALADRDLSSLRWVLFAGEPFPTKQLRRVMAAVPQARFSNLYGPTETNVCTYFHVSPPGDDSPIPIGTACEGEELLVLDEHDEPVQPGQPGTLLVRGGTVMVGYWGRPDLDGRVFYRRPGEKRPFYRTGDRVQMRPDGNLMYLGRQDRQIKSRGYRIELDEIETAVMEHDAVQETAVYALPDGLGSYLIAASVVLRPGREMTPADLRTYLADRLPPFALPVRVGFLKQLPRTSTGKIDRRKLADLADPEAENG